MNYRSDIDGLRTVAVLAVVIFHFNSDILPGGFAGVDVFFAISGFLMTGIILTGINKDSFSLSKFYLSRAKRIIPALTVLCLSLMLLGWFILPPLDYSNLSKHALSSMSFVSNVVYWQESGYFDAEAHEKWLLHTWSLSVEWQFYLIYPILLLTWLKISNGRWVGVFLIVLSFVGYIYGVWSSNTLPVQSYFILPSRAWEMLAGGVAYVYAIRLTSRVSVFFHYIGLTLIISSYFIISSVDQWPGFKAIIPVAGACLFLMANHNGFIARFKPSIQVGKWSYSIYLWHWPVVVYCHTNKIDINVAFGLAISLFVGFLSYLVVEKRRTAKSLVTTPFVVIASALVMINNGYAYQMPKYVYASSMLNPNEKEFGEYTWRNIKNLNSSFDGGNRKILVIGDSMAGDFINVMFDAEVQKTAQVRSRIISAPCGAFYLNQKQRDYLYVKSDDIRGGRITKDVCDKEIGRLYNDGIIVTADVVVVAMNWREYALPFIRQSLLNIRKKTNAPVFLVGTKGFQELLPRIIYYAYVSKIDIGHLAYKKSEATFVINDHLKEATKTIQNVYFIDIKNSLCSHSEKSCLVMNDGFPVLYDAMHSTAQGVSLISKLISSQISEIKGDASN